MICDYDETNPKHKSPEKHKATNLDFGKGLGQWEDEFNGEDHIVELVVGGAKSYSYKTNKGNIVVKQKGIALAMADDEVVNFGTMRDTVLNDAALMEKPQYEEVLDKRTNKTKTVKVVATIKSKERFQFKWDTLTKDIITPNVSRIIKPTMKDGEGGEFYLSPNRPCERFYRHLDKAAKDKAAQGQHGHHA